MGRGGVVEGGDAVQRLSGRDDVDAVLEDVVVVVPGRDGGGRAVNAVLVGLAAEVVLHGGLEHLVPC